MTARLIEVGWNFDSERGLGFVIGESIRAYDYCTADHQIYELAADLKLHGEFVFALHRPAENDWRPFVGFCKRGKLEMLDASRSAATERTGK